MPISVTTGGPLSDTGALWGDNLRSFNDMVRALSDELDDAHGDYKSQIHMAIFAALRFCAREPFYFNEARDVVFHTVAGKAWYDASDNSHIGTLAGLGAVTCQRGATGHAWQLEREDPARLEVLDASGVSGRPQKFCYFGQKLRLSPRPDHHDYRIRLQLAPIRFEKIEDATQDNIWFMQAFDLIFARAKYELYKNTVKDGAAALVAKGDFDEQLHMLRAETSRRKTQGHIQPTLF